MNRVVLSGRLTGDPELRTTTGGKDVADFSIAVRKRFKTDGEDADFFRVTCWGKTAKYVHGYCGKGDMIELEGRIQSRKYVASDGSKREVVEVVADSIQKLQGNAKQPSSEESDPEEFDPFQ